MLEPIQSADSIEGQLAELDAQLRDAATAPVILVGYSWGATLACLYAAQHPHEVADLVLVSSAGFLPGDGEATRAARIARLSPAERDEVIELDAVLGDPGASDAERRAAMARIGALWERADAFDPLPDDEPAPPVEPEVHRRVWAEAAQLRESGALLVRVGQIGCEVVAIHGDHDSHPAASVREPLTRALPRFRFILLHRCGHRPWLERHAADRFYRVLEAEVSRPAASPR